MQEVSGASSFFQQLPPSRSRFMHVATAATKAAPRPLPSSDSISWYCNMDDFTTVYKNIRYFATNLREYMA